MIRLWPFGSKRTPQPDAVDPPQNPPQPMRRTYVVGDVHGCLAQLQHLLTLIDTDRGDVDADIVFVGDYADRGPDSPATLSLLMQLESGNANVHCLMGNHDKMLLDFIDGTPKCMRWLDIGGFDTLITYNVSHLRGDTPQARQTAQAEGLARAMGPELVGWLRTRPLWWQSGDLIAVHALTDPDLPMEEQSPRTLLWERPDDTLRPRSDGTWVVHGHTIVREPRVEAGHIAIDTGVYRDKPLTAAVLGDGPIRFLSAPPD